MIVMHCMQKIRSYKDQFGPDDTQKIETIFQILDALKSQEKSINFHCQEIRGSLSGGSILGGLLITFSMFEMLFIEKFALLSSNGHSEEFLDEIFSIEKNKTSLSCLIKESKTRGFICQEDAEYLLDLYDKVRNVLSHGLRTKGIYSDNYPFHSRLYGNKEPVHWREIENSIEEIGLYIIIEILNFLRFNNLFIENISL